MRVTEEMITIGVRAGEESGTLNRQGIENILHAVLGPMPEPPAPIDRATRTCAACMGEGCVTGDRMCVPCDGSGRIPV